MVLYTLKNVVVAGIMFSIFLGFAGSAFALTSSETEVHDAFYAALRKGDYSAAEDFYETFTQFPTSQNLRQNQIGLGYSFVNEYIDARKFEEARRILEKMAAFNEKDDMYELYACAFVNLGLAYAQNGQSKSAERLLKAMEPYCFNRIMQEHQGQAAFNLVTVYGEAGKLKDSRRVFDLIEGFEQTDGTDNNHILYWKAKAAANLTHYYSKAGNFAEADKMYHILQEFGDRENTDIQRELARSNYAMFLAYWDKNRKEEATPYFEKIESFGNTNDIWGWKAKAASYYLYDFAEAKDKENALEYYDMMMEMPAEFPQVQFWQAYAEHLYIYYMLQLDEIDAVEKVYKSLMARNLSEEGQKWQIEGSLYMLEYYGKAKEYDKAREVIKKLQAVSNSEEVMATVIMGSFKMLDMYIQSGKIDEAKELYKEIEKSGFVTSKRHKLEMQKYWQRLNGLIDK